MNWKLRMKNKTTLTAIIGVALLLIKQIADLFGLNLDQQIEQIADILGTVILLFVALGVVNDPTTYGVKDTDLAKGYGKPRNPYLTPVDFVKTDKDTDDHLAPESKAKTLETFDTDDPFTDDSDEVEFDVADDEPDENQKRGASAYHDDEVLKVSDHNGSETDETRG